uniref:Uncharacterized protein n=1 Tax=Arundo donax TaxID=35708 RepID=A0A0A9AXD1_ARUDO
MPLLSGVRYCSHDRMKGGKVTG